MIALDLVADDDGVAERRFEFDAGHGPVPGLLWTPSSGAGPWPAVLIGHGRGGSKSTSYGGALARRLAREQSWAAVALDAPHHGDRRDPGDDPAQPPPKPDAAQARQEWQACIDALAGQGVIDTGALGYWGISMGAALGIALLAAEPRVRCAAIGLMHNRYYDQILADAARIRCPVLFLVQWDDERVPRAEAFDVFDHVASQDKRLHAHPGGHGEMPQEAITASERFLVRYLERAAG
jgi:dienelactone hydrolase